MDALIPYSIPVRGLHEGMHQFDFQIDKNFFSCFEDSPIEEGNIDMRMYFEKRPDMYILVFDFKGTIKTACDRCLAAIDLPIKGDQQLIVKFSEEEREEAEVVYVTPGIQSIKVAKYIYEFICLAIPMIKVYACEEAENPPCNKEMLKYLEEDVPEEEKKTTENPIWDELKKLKM
ncbi:MAG: DUF177 domain-containing protein [Bacteroidetes bacterium]|nr:DUF177 domain-containing protein [Bacteroidota bacterium]